LIFFKKLYSFRVSFSNVKCSRIIVPFTSSFFQFKVAGFVLGTRGLFLISVLLCTLGTYAFAQSPDGTVQSSWEKSKKNAGDNLMRQKPAEKKSYWDKDSVSYWKKMNPQKSGQPANESVISSKNLYQTNDRLIDSLSHLYCVSANYIVDLRIQNHIAFDEPADAASPSKSAASPKKSAPASLSDPQALHKKLVELLHRCLHAK
jgi:hypothetical protein